MGLDGCVIRCPASVGDLAAAPHSGVLWRAAPGRLLLEVPEVARYLVSDGNLVEIEPCGAAGEVRRILRMTPTAALYLQRGIPVLHAAVAADAAGHAIILAGSSSVGKSVLLAVLAQRGWSVLTDDLAPVTLDDAGVPAAMPTWAEIILWPDADGTVAGLSPAVDGPDVAEFGPSGSRRAVDWSARFVGEARPVSAIWWLGVHRFDPIRVCEVKGTDRFEAFAAMAYHRRIASALLDRASYLRVAAAVAGSGIPIRRLIRPHGRWTAEELADIVEGQSGAEPAGPP
jgi:hypothetical protein